MKITVTNALELAEALTDAAVAAEAKQQTEFDFDFIQALQGADDATRAELQAAIDAPDPKSTG
jgi:hypothetical protein